MATQMEILDKNRLLTDFCRKTNLMKQRKRKVLCEKIILYLGYVGLPFIVRTRSF